MHGRLALQNSYTTGALSHARRGATADASTGKSDRPEAFAIRLLLLTGARKSEILKARWENVRLDLRLLVVPLSKSGRPRHILLSDAALEVLRVMPHSPGNPWRFPGHAPGKPLSDLYLF